MAYLFGAGGSDHIDCGTAVAKGTTFSVAVRVKPTAANNADRVLCVYDNGTNRSQFYLVFTTGGPTNQLAGGFSHSGGTFTSPVAWTTGWGAGTVHTTVFTYDGAFQRLYADGDATQKAAVAETHAVDQDAGMTFTIGNETGSATRSAGSTIYEVAWWPGTALIGAQCAQLGASSLGGFDAGFIRPRPSAHWRLIGDANDRIAGNNGTVTGATLVAHDARIRYPVPGRMHRFTSPAAPPPSYSRLTYLGRDGWRGAFRGVAR